MAKQETKKSGKIILTKFKAGVVILFFLVTILVVGLLAGLLKPNTCPKSHVETAPSVGAVKVPEKSPVPSMPKSPKITAEKTPTEEKEKDIWENHRLPPNIIPDHYDLVLFPDFYDGGDKFYGNVSIRLNITGTSVDCLLVHIKALNIIRTKVRLLTEEGEDATLSPNYLSNDEGRELEIKRNFSYTSNEYWVIQTQKKITSGSVVVVDMQFEGSLNRGMAGLYRSKYIDSRTGQLRFLATSKFQPTDARKAFPCLDEPGFKSTFTVTLIHRPGYTALSNMPEEASTNYSDGLIATRFQKSVPMVTYLACFIVCDFASKTTTSNGIPLRVFATPDKIDQVNYALSISGSILRTYEETFGLRYPLPKLDQIAIPDFTSGAMEHWGLVTYRETFLLYDEKEGSAFNKQRVAVVIAHELAHMWFGNLVTMHWWDDLWLNEGFASYVEYLGVDKVHPEWNMDAQFLVDDMQIVMAMDSTISSHPIVMPVHHPDQISEAFDSISYSKGASVLRMLDNVMGSKNFRDGLQVYMKKYQYSTAATADLWRCLSQVNGTLDVNAIMDTWTRQMGYPVVDVHFYGDHFRLKQKRFLVDPTANKTHPPSIFNYIWQIPLSFTTSTGQTQLVWLKTEKEKFDLPKSIREAPNWVKFNVNATSYLRVNYPDHHWKNWAQVLQNNSAVISASDRCNLIDDAFHLARAGHVNYRVPLELVKYLDKENEFVPWKAFENHAVYIREMLQYSPHFGQWKKYIGDLLQPVIGRIGYRETKSHDEQLLQSTLLAIACGVGNRNCISNVTAIFTAWLNQGQYIIPNTRAIVYRYGMRTVGHELEWNKLWEHYVNTSIPQEKNRLLGGLAQAKEAWLLNRLLDYSMDESKIRSQDFFTAIAYLTSNPLGRSLVWDWVRIKWSKLVEKFTLNNRNLGRLVPTVVHFFNTPFQLQQVESFFARHPESGAGERARSLCLDQIRANIAWIDRNMQDIADWLTDQGYAQ